ncbi:hypothetical protein J3P89_22110 [Pseudomonas sp. Z1-14]|uniref:hypothetical protein n=1 Tax=Pseudomonas sp. Z1-14 TaxID=2817409 RepID=UPI003DA82B0C
MHKRLPPPEKTFRERESSTITLFPKPICAYSIQPLYFCYKPAKAINDIPRQYIIQDETMRKKKACAGQAFF